MSGREPRDASVAAWAAFVEHPPVGRLGHWRLKPEASAAAFTDGWREVAEWALATQKLAACPFLLQDENDPREFIGWWPFATVDDYLVFKDSPELKARLAPLGEMLERIDDAVFRLAASPRPAPGCTSRKD